MEKLNIAEILKDCPKGMELDCTMYDDVTFGSVDDKKDTPYPIKVLIENGASVALTKYGQYTNANFAKCVIFPKGKTTWEGFQRPFKDGDVVVCIDTNKCGKEEACQIFILKSQTSERNGFCYTGYDFKRDKFFDAGVWSFERHATEEEKQKLFDAIKENGYKWNAETKTLEKLIEPKFKVGDRIRNKKYSSETYSIVGIYETKYDVGKSLFIDFKSQDYWELIPNKFDITTLNPFDKVLVRRDDTDYWKPAFWGRRITSNNFPFITSYGATSQAIPFKSNEHLLGTTNNCDEYYKTW